MAFTVGDPRRPGEEALSSTVGTTTPGATTSTTVVTTSADGTALAAAGVSKPFEAYAGLVDLPSIRSKTKWNPPIPKVLDNAARRARNTPRGWFAADPMLITGYELATPGTKPAADLPTSTGEADSFGFDSREYGFRFLFNPSHVSEAYTNTNQVDPIAFMRTLQKMDVPVITQQSGSTMSLELFLSRVDDMRILRRSNWASYYPGTVSEEDRKQLLQRGTMHDLEYLFRLTNGKRFPTWWNDVQSSDWGVFFPRPILVSIGDGPTSIRIRAIISSLNISHTVFAPGMIPTVTTITVSLERLLDQMTQGIAWDAAATDVQAAQQSSPAGSGMVNPNQYKYPIGPGLNGLPGISGSANVSAVTRDFGTGFRNPRLFGSQVKIGQ